MSKGKTVSIVVDFVWNSTANGWQLRTTVDGQAKTENAYVFDADMSSVSKSKSLYTGSSTSHNAPTATIYLGGSDGTAVSKVAKLQAPIEYRIQGTTQVVATDTYVPTKYGTATVSPNASKVPAGYSLVSTAGVSVKTTKDGSTPNPIVFYVKAESATHTLKYDLTGGTGNFPDQSSTTDTGSATFTIHNGTPQKSGYTFEGWATTASATTASYQPGGTITVTGTTTLYAVWEAAPAKDVQQTGEGTVTIRKRFVGADMPASFLMTYDISNEKSGPFASDVIDFTLVSGTQYTATIKYPVWTFSGDWTAAEKAQYDSKIVLTEYDADIQGKDLTVSAIGATADNDARTISFTVGASLLSGGTKVITNTYTDNTPPVADKNLTGISKVRLTKNDTIPAGINPDDYNLEEDIVLSTTQTTNLLYLITVNGDVGANYDVEDANVTVVSGSLNGTITGTAAYIYVSQAVTASSLQNGMAVNTAVLTPGENTKFSDGATSKQDTAEVPVITYTNPEPEKSVEQRIAGTDEWIEVDPDYPEVEPGAELRYTVRVQNTNSVTFSGLRVIDDMADGLVLDEDSCEGTVIIS